MFDNRCGVISPDGCGCLKMKGHQFMGSFPCQNQYNHKHIPGDRSFVLNPDPTYPKEWCGYCLEYDCIHMQEWNESKQGPEIPQVFKDAFEEEEDK